MQKAGFLVWVPNQVLLGIIPLAQSFQVTFLPSLKSCPCDNNGLGCGVFRLGKLYCLSSVDLKFSVVLVRLNEEMPKAATPTGTMIRDSCENLLQSSVTERIRAIYLDWFLKGKKVSSVFWLKMWTSHYLVLWWPVNQDQH